MVAYDVAVCTTKCVRFRRSSVICLASGGADSFLVDAVLAATPRKRLRPIAFGEIEMQKLIVGLVLLLVMAPWERCKADDNDTRRSVVKIEVTHVRPDYYEPWKREPAADASGTGVVISGNRILTNAHVISYAKKITVQPFQSAKKYPAKVIASSPRMDLAILSVDEEGFFDDRPAIDFDRAMPAVRSTVNAYGFPFGGTQISVTEGIVSRIEYKRYYFSSSGLRIQIDAALNPGNSGGPAVKDGRLVGLVFSKISRGDNVGYLIPTEEIQLFLDDVQDGNYDGKLVFPRVTQTLENDAIRKKLGLDDDVGGVMIADHATESQEAQSGESLLRKWDVITHVDGQSVDRQGKVTLEGEIRVPFTYLIQKHNDDDIIDMSLFRDGQPIDIKLQLSRNQNWLTPPLEYGQPSYFIIGPMFFMPASQELVRGLTSSRRWSNTLIYRSSPLVTRGYDRQKEPEGDEQLVVTGAFLPHSMTQGYSEPDYDVVEKLNGVMIKNIKQLVENIRDSKDETLVFEFAGNGSENLVWDRESFIEATESVLDDNGIRRQGSANLMKVWEEKPR